MRIAILGATSEIARDLVNSLRFDKKYKLKLFSRRPAELEAWLKISDPRNIPPSHSLSEFSPTIQFDAILNFIGAGNPRLISDLGESIIELTHTYDQLVLDYIKIHPHCRYIFMSSGSVFGENFEKPVDSNSQPPELGAELPSTNWYQSAKLSTEILHRKLINIPITDLRIFNYFSHTQSIESQFLMASIARALINQSTLEVSPEHIIRDFLHPTDFYEMINCILMAAPKNQVLDCYSKSPISKRELLEYLQKRFGLKFKESEQLSPNPTGVKTHYYSQNKQAQNLGYFPKYSSLEGIDQELELLIQKS